MPDSPDFDLDAFVSTTMPAMLETEADDAAWRAGYGDGRDVRRPVTALTAEDSPLQAFLSSTSTHPEGASRAEQAEFYAARDAARAAAVEAAQDAAAEHAHWIEAQKHRATADAFFAQVDRITKRAEERDKGTGAIPVRSAQRPADYGRW